MDFATGDDLQIGLVAETAFGVPPASPVFLLQRVTSIGLQSTKTTQTSDELGGRDLVDDILVGFDVTGDLGFELSWGAFDTLFAAAFCADWDEDVLVNGTVAHSLFLEEKARLGSGASYARYDGCMVNTLSLDIQSRQKITGTLGIMGRRETLGSAALAGATYTAAPTEPIEAAGLSVAALDIIGLPVQPKIRRLQLQITNNLRTRPDVEDLYSNPFGIGEFGVSGTLEAYFTSADLYEAVLDHGSGAISVTLGASANKKYRLRIPTARLGNGQRQARTKNTDITVSIPFRGIRTAALGGTMEITRGVA